jgi:hypothetical protein
MRDGYVRLLSTRAAGCGLWMVGLFLPKWIEPKLRSLILASLVPVSIRHPMSTGAHCTPRRRRAPASPACLTTCIFGRLLPLLVSVEANHLQILDAINTIFRYLMLLTIEFFLSK